MAIVEKRIIDLSALKLHVSNNFFVHAQVKYLPHLGCFVSCCKDANTALCLAAIDHDLQRKVVPTYFRVTKGINTFDFCKHLNMIVTGGYDALIRVWNPYISSR